MKSKASETVFDTFIMKRPFWCNIGWTFEWKAPQITGFDSVTEKIIGYTDSGFLHTSANYPVYETSFDDLNTGRIVVPKEGDD